MLSLAFTHDSCSQDSSTDLSQAPVADEICWENQDLLLAFFSRQTDRIGILFFWSIEFLSNFLFFVPPCKSCALLIVGLKRVCGLPKGKYNEGKFWSWLQVLPPFFFGIWRRNSRVFVGCENLTQICRITFIRLIILHLIEFYPVKPIYW